MCKRCFGGDVNWQQICNRGQNPLHYAAQGGSPDVVRYLIGAGIDMNCVDECARTPLVVAIREGNLEIVQALLDKGADVNLELIYNRTALIPAINAGNLEIVQALLDKGADVNLELIYNRTALIPAINAGNLEIVQALLDKGADVNLVNCYQKPLVVAIQEDNLEIVQALLDKGADVNYIDKNGKTPLHYAQSDDMKTLIKQHQLKKLTADVLNQVRVDVEQKQVNTSKVKQKQDVKTQGVKKEVKNKVKNKVAVEFSNEELLKALELRDILQKLRAGNAKFQRLTQKHVEKIFTDANAKGGYTRAIEYDKNADDDTKTMRQFSVAFQEACRAKGVLHSDGRDRYGRLQKRNNIQARNINGMRTKSAIDYVGGKEKMFAVIQAAGWRV